MFRTSKRLVIAMVAAGSALIAADVSTARGGLTATEIVDKNVAARGGLEAWRAVQTMSISGKLGAGGNQRPTLRIPGQKVTPDMLRARPAEEVQLPFRMQLARPHKMRFELQFNGQTAVQVFDGSKGWKLRPFLNRNAVEPYTADELKTASMQADLDGPLVDYQAKGMRVELAGTDRVEDRDTYKIKLTMKDGQVIHVWIDTQTFLEAKIEGQPRRMDGVDHPVEVYFRDYRNVNGLRIPFILETKVGSVGRTVLGLQDPAVPPEKVVIEKVELNPKLDQALFSEPKVQMAASAR